MIRVVGALTIVRSGRPAPAALHDAGAGRRGGTEADWLTLVRAVATLVRGSRRSRGPWSTR